MSKHPEDDIVFAGDSADNAEDFIAAVNRASWRAGKQEDLKWTAQLAYSCFIKGALIWYEGLSDEVQADWKLLRAAIMLEYVAPSSAPADKPEESPSGSNQKGRDRRGTVVGRIRVNYTSAGTDGYLASTVFEDAWSTVSSTVDGAALFQFTPAQKTIKYLGTESFLMIGSWMQGPNLLRNTENFMGLFKYPQPVYHSTQINNSWKGPIQSALWSLEGQNRLQARWVSDNGGDYTELQTVIKNQPTHEVTIYFGADPCALYETLKTGNGTYKYATLYFEPVQL